jgi:hypothetical protein
MKPEDKAFQIAESGISVSHAKIIDNLVPPSPFHFTGETLGGTYDVTITGSQPYWTVVSEGSYIEEGVNYRRKIQEDLGYRNQVFDAMRQYMLVAGNSIVIDVDDLANAGIPMTINGSMRAQNSVSVYLNPTLGVGDGLTINGDVEAEREVYIESIPSFIGLLSQLTVNGDLRSNSEVILRADGTNLLLPLLGWIDVSNIFTNTIQKQELNGDGIVVDGTEQTGWQGLTRIPIPQPNMAYYKALAQQQGNYYTSNVTFTNKNLSELSRSSFTVIYAKGSITLNGFAFDQPNMKGVFVAEGHFTANNTLRFSENSKFQAIANGRVTFNNDWDFFGFGATDEFFLWSGNDLTINMGMFSGIRLQATTRNTLYMNSDNIVGTCVVNYGVPDVDVGGFPVDMTVYSWKELPVD